MTTLAASRLTASVALRELLNTRPLVEISSATELGWRLSRHGLTDAPGRGLEHLAGVHCGLHAARQLTPWVTLHARDPLAAPVQLREALNARRLLRLRCMRRTLHLVPPDLAPVVHAATLSQRLGPCHLAIKRSGISQDTLKSLRSAVRARLDADEVAYRALQHGVLVTSPRSIRRRTDAVLLARLIIKTMWEEGELVVGDSSPSLHHEHRTFALTANAVSGLDLNQLTPAQAIVRLLALYLDGYGPASVRDFHWWSGVGLTQGLPAWQSLEDQLVRVRIAGLPDDELLALDRNVSQLLEGQWEDRVTAPAQVLAYEDPSLKGYFGSRWRYADLDQLPRLFNSIGEARASVMIQGRIVAIWHWDRRTQLPRLEPLRRLDASERRQLDRALDRVTTYLRTDPLQA